MVLRPWIATCHETPLHLSDYLDDDLPRRTRNRVRRHLARCERCRALLASLERALAAVRSLGEVTQPPPSPATVTAVIRRIQHE
ncbi:MAG: anti-sigma factor family protein [Gaiellaceae bacterium]